MSMGISKERSGVAEIVGAYFCNQVKSNLNYPMKHCDKSLPHVSRVERIEPPARAFRGALLLLSIMLAFGCQPGVAGQVRADYIGAVANYYCKHQHFPSSSSELLRGVDSTAAELLVDENTRFDVKAVFRARGDSVSVKLLIQDIDEEEFLISSKHAGCNDGLITVDQQSFMS